MIKAKYIKLSKYAKEKGIHYNTAMNHFKAGKIAGAIQRETGSIYVPSDWDIKPTFKEKTCVLYARVSSSENKDNLISQLERLRSYANAKGYTIINEYKEIGSGLNDNRKILTSILERNDFQIIVVEHKDRLTRFGFNYIQSLLKTNNRLVDVSNLVEEKDASLVEDLISIIYSFSARMYGLRKGTKTTKKLLSVIRENN